MREQHGPIRAQSGPLVDGQSKGRFGNYDLVRRIDVGGMGEVYLARQRTAFGREVAVKIIRSDLIHEVSARQRFLREAEVSAHLKHEHILPLFEFGEEQGRLFLVTPYIQGGTLARRLQDGPISLPEVHQLFSALVKAVAYIHKRGVIHRDLKPNNILLDQEDGSDQIYVRLIDFGIASISGELASPPLTTAGNEIGTLAYMAPERLHGVAAVSNDIFSLGIILHQMLTGQVRSRDEMTSMPQSLQAIVQRCIAPNPDQRFLNADDLLRAFEQALQAERGTLRRQFAIFPSSQVSAVETEDDQAGPAITKRLPEAHPIEVKQPEPEKNQMQPVQAARLAQLDQPGEPPAPKDPAQKPARIFSGEDYNAPTAAIDVGRLNTAKAHQMRFGNDTASLTPPPSSPPPQKRRGGGFMLAIIPLSIVMVMLAIAAIVLYAFQAAATAQVSISPKVHVLNKVLTVTAKPGLKQASVAGSAIPLNTLTISKTEAQTGQATGRPFLCLFDCPTTVSTEDVIKVAQPLKTGLIEKVKQELNTQLKAKNGTAVGNPVVKDGNFRVEPFIGTASETVTVTLTEQGSVNYYSNDDVKKLAGQLLKDEAAQQYGEGYTLLEDLTQIGQPATQQVSPDGSVKIAIAIGGVVQYQITPQVLSGIQKSIRGKTQQEARKLIAERSGIDPENIIIQISYGDTLPGTAEQITVKPVNPSDIPPVQLPAVTPGATTPTT